MPTMTRPPDRVEMLGGITHLPAEIREVARLSNLAGINGFELADIEIGVDREQALAVRRITDEAPILSTYLMISYKEKPDA